MRLPVYANIDAVPFLLSCAVCAAGPEPRLLHGASSSLVIPHVCTPEPAGMVLRRQCDEMLNR